MRGARVLKKEKRKRALNSGNGEEPRKGVVGTPPGTTDFDTPH